MTSADVGLGTWVIHRCDLSHPMFDGAVTHIVLPPRRPCSTPLSDIRDAGFDVVGYGVFPSELDGCDVAGIGGEQVLLRPAEPITNDLGKE